MKKILISLGLITLVAVLGVAIVFAYGSYKDLELKKEEAKLEHNKSKHKQTDKQNEKNNSETTNNNEQARIEDTATSQGDTSSPVKNTTDNHSVDEENPESVYSLETDYDGDGVISREEMTPEQERLFKEGKFQPAIPLKEQREANKAFPAEKIENNDDDSIDKNWDEQAAYEAQKKVYEKAARGEIPEPGAFYNEEMKQ